MAEERGLKVDFAGYEAAKQVARETSGGAETRKEVCSMLVRFRRVVVFVSSFRR